MGLVGLKTIIGSGGLFFRDFWYGSVYSFILSDYIYVMLAEWKGRSYKWTALRFAFYLIAIYASAEVTVTYSTLLDRFINTVNWAGWVVFALSGGTVFVPWLYFRWKYREEKKREPEPPAILQGL